MNALTIDFTLSSQTPQRAACSQDYVPPNQLSSKSSPIVPVARNERVRHSNMHWTKSFATKIPGYDGPGDTQPMDSQTFRNHSDIGLSKSVMEANIAASEREQLVIADSELLVRGGHGVDLTDDGENGLEDNDDISSLNRTDDLSPVAPTRNQAEIVALFKTPLRLSRKRNWHGEIISSEIRTSSTRGPGSALKPLLELNAGNALNMTQLFQQTQAGSSPPPGGPHSDTIFDRPSPSMQMRQSSPRPITISSPIRPSTSDGVGNDPLSAYRTMKESQESRAKRLRREEEQRMLENFEEDEFDDDSLAELQRRNMRQRQKTLLVSNIEFKAPRRLQRSSANGRSKSADHLSSERHPFTPASNGVKLQHFSPHPVSDMVDQLNLLDTVREDELQTDPAGVQVPMTSSKPLRRSQSKPSQQPSRSSSQHSAGRDPPTQMTIAVQDSQGERQSEPSTPDPPAPLAISSSAVSGRLVAQSQYSVLTSETRAMLSQRLRAVTQQQSDALQVKEDVPNDGADAIRSSPPIFSEHDNEYADESDIEVEEEDEEMVDAGLEDERQGDERKMGGADEKEEVEVEAPYPIAEEVEEVDLLPSALPDGHVPTEESHRKPAFRSDTEQAALKLMDGLHTSPVQDDREDTDPLLEHATGFSMGTEPFETAVTHQTPASSSRVRQLAQSEQGSQVSPIKRVTDIAAALSPRRSGESCDLDSLVDNIFSDGDRDFLKTVGEFSPARPTKRARAYSGKRSILREPSLNANLPRSPKNAKTTATITPKYSEDLTSSVASASAPAPNGIPENELLIEVPEVANSTPDTPISVRRREAEGSKAALEARKLVASRKVAPPARGKKRGRKPAALRMLNRGRATKSTGGAPEVEAEQSAITPQLVISNGDRFVTSPPTSSNTYNPQTDAHDTANDVASPASKILALFKDMKLYYYPATYLETIYPDGERFKVKFCDGTVAVLFPSQVRSFELRINDCVKLDLHGMRKGTYLIQGFADGADEVVPTTAFRDAGGHEFVKVVPKAADGITATQEPIVVSVERIYLTGNMLPTFAGRKFTPPTKGPDRFSTPALLDSEPTTPGSRSKRQNFSTSVHGDHAAHVSSSLFSNMLFAVTFVNDHDQSIHKETVVKQIGSNGGRILEHGFDAIFEADASMPASPKKSPARSKTSPNATNSPLRLRPGTQHLGFTAVIADRHCRKEKYLQALALGIPCLHYRWITDCVAASVTLPFERYLLAAGESDFLFGAVRSRTLAPYDPNCETGALQQVLECRSQPLRDDTVLLVMSSADRRKAYQFLAYAAGAASVRCVHNMNEGRKCIDAGLAYDWVLCDGDRTKAREALLAPKLEANKKKKKRDSEIVPSTPRKVMKVTDSEFLVQSLILGALVDL
jgi:hypothetical protein